MKTICVDVDDVCLALVETWLEVYRADYGHNLTKDQILEWDISKYVLPECGNDIFKYIEDPNLYYGVDPIENALEGVKLLKNFGYRIIYATISTEGARGAKYKRLKELGFIDTPKDYIECGDKSLIKADYIIDDNPENIETFSGIGILFNQPWNKNYKYTLRVKDWNDIMELFKRVQLHKEWE